MGRAGRIVVSGRRDGLSEQRGHRWRSCSACASSWRPRWRRWRARCARWTTRTRACACAAPLSRTLTGPVVCSLGWGHCLRRQHTQQDEGARLRVRCPPEQNPSRPSSVAHLGLLRLCLHCLQHQLIPGGRGRLPAHAAPTSPDTSLMPPKCRTLPLTSVRVHALCCMHMRGSESAPGCAPRAALPTLPQLPGRLPTTGSLLHASACHDMPGHTLEMLGNPGTCRRTWLRWRSAARRPRRAWRTSRLSCRRCCR